MAAEPACTSFCCTGVTVAAVLLTGQLSGRASGRWACCFSSCPFWCWCWNPTVKSSLRPCRSGWQWEEGWLMDTLKWISPFSAYLFALSWGMKELGNHIPALIVTVLAVLALGSLRNGPVPSAPAGKRGAGHGLQTDQSPDPARIMVWGFGVMGALFFWMIQSRPYWAVFGAVMGALISHCVIEVIYHFDFKKLFAHWPQLILAAALSMALFFSFRFDWWGYDSYLPAGRRRWRALRSPWIWTRTGCPSRKIVTAARRQSVRLLGRCGRIPDGEHVRYGPSAGADAGPGGNPAGDEGPGGTV